MGDKTNSRLLESCRRDAVEWTRELVRRNSENPPGRELDCIRWCGDILRGLGMEVSVDEFAPGRANLTAFAGDRNQLGIVFNGHIDTVPVKDGWDDPPFDAVLRDGCIWGRGSADMKSGCAAMMAAAKYVLQAGLELRRGFALTLVADEECVNRGALRLQRTTPLSADACIVCEPTQLQVHYGNRGFTSYYIRTYGKSCHGCEPRRGVNAIYKMARVLVKLEQFAAEFSQRINPQLGEASMSVGTIRGGTSLNTVPDFCEIELEARVFPGMRADGICRELQELLGGEAAVSVRSELPASLVPLDSGIVRIAGECVRAATGRDAVAAKFPACSEASFFSEGYGIPTVLLGPGDIGCAHKANEHVPVEEIRQAVDIYAMLMEAYSVRMKNQKEVSVDEHS